jgi:hypothetical protein
MIDIKSLEVLKTMLSEGLVLDAPRVDTVVPVIRSGDQMLFRNPGKSWLSKEQRRRLKGRLDIGSSAGDVDDDDDDSDEENDLKVQRNAARRALLGQVAVEFGFDVMDEKQADFAYFLDWYEDYAVSVLRTAGIRYRGTYAVYASSEKTAGKYRTIWSFRGSQAIDRMTSAAEPPPAMGITDLGAITRRLRALADTRPGSGRSQSWYQPAWGFRP